MDSWRRPLTLCLLWAIGCENHASSGYVRMPAGSFEMGCTPGQQDCFANGLVFVRLTHAFWMEPHEVTQGEFEAEMRFNHSTFVSCGDNCPVDTVSWEEAAMYANLVSESEWLPDCYTCTESSPTTCTAAKVYDCPGYRLPTEAEWEYAARCGQDLDFAGSTIAGEVAWVMADATHPVETKEDNGCDLFDMSGNVFEWVNDWSQGYPFGTTSDDPAVDPTGATPVDVECCRVLRGGGWDSAPLFATVSARAASEPHFRSDDLGFRLVRTADLDD